MHGSLSTRLRPFASASCGSSSACATRFALHLGRHLPPQADFLRCSGLRLIPGPLVLPRTATIAAVPPRRMKARDPAAKCLIFSQFTGFLDILNYRLEQVGRLSLDAAATVLLLIT